MYVMQERTFETLDEATRSLQETYLATARHECRIRARVYLQDYPRLND